MIETNIPEINVDELMERIRAEVKQRKEGGGSPRRTIPQASFTPPSDIYAKIDLSRIGAIADPEPFEYKEQGYHINDFLKYHDQQFVMNAYRGILRRGPDSGGIGHFLDKLRSGKMTKAEILGRLRYSPEGKTNKVKIIGLFWNFAIQSSFRIPALGYCSRLTTGITNLPLIIRNMENFERNTVRQLQQQSTDLNGTLSELGSYLEKKADRQDLEMGLEKKADRQELEMGLEKKADRQELEVGLERKADRQDLEMGLEKKADRQELEVGLEKKADRQELEVGLERKADRQELEMGLEKKADRDDLVVGLEKKADRHDLEMGLERKADKEQVKNIKDQIRDILRQTRDHKLNILDQQRRLMLLLEEARKRLPEPISTEQIKEMLTEEDHVLNALYVSFEDRFRGTRADIKQRVTIYLPIVREAKAGTKAAPVLDIGCGRGEWLELLQENDLVARGVDLNRIMISQCQELGLEVAEADALSYLRNIQANSLGMVTGIHIIEHLTLKRLVALFDEVLRVLKPGGVAIFETPNPENLVVGSCNFYYDPTHLNPLPPEPTRFLMEARGFDRIDILRLHPQPESAMLREGSAQVQQIVNALLFGPQDYSLVGYKV